MNEQPSEALSPSQAAKLAGVGRTRLYQLMSSGVLPSFKIGKLRRIRRQTVLDWQKELELDAIATGYGLKECKASTGLTEKRLPSKG
jgi:excisionase family DNA binding protein